LALDQNYNVFFRTKLKYHFKIVKELEIKNAMETK